MVVSWWFIAVYEDWLKFIVTHCYLFVVCLWFMNPITMESVKSQKYGGFMVIYCGLWRLIEIYCYSLLLICDLFVVYESNNYGICKIGKYGGFMVIYCGLWRLIEIYCFSLLLICDLFVVYESKNYGIWKTRIMRWFHGVLLRFMKIDWDLSLLIVTYVWFVCGLWIQ